MLRVLRGALLPNLPKLVIRQCDGERVRDRMCCRITRLLVNAYRNRRRAERNQPPVTREYSNRPAGLRDLQAPPSTTDREAIHEFAMSKSNNLGEMVSAAAQVVREAVDDYVRRGLTSPKPTPKPSEKPR